MATTVDPGCQFEAEHIGDADRVFLQRLRAGNTSSLRVCLSCLIAGVALVLSSPLLLAAFVLIRITSRGPAIYRQTRVGLNGELFEVYKFRTMVVDAEAGTGPVWSLPNDPRVTPVGHWLRKLHLDELPQLVNVIKGDMALIGPRPERPEIAERLQTELNGFGKRLAVRPGITGLAQINFPTDTDRRSFRRKFLVDIDYVVHAGLLLDMRIALATVPRLLGVDSKILRRLLGVYRYIPTSLEHDFALACQGDTDTSSIIRFALPEPADDRAENDAHCYAAAAEC